MALVVEFLRTKDQAFEKFKNYVAYLERQYNFLPKWFRANNGSEYITGDLQQWCASKGIKLEYTAPYSLVQNGVAEHMNRTLVELAHAMIFSTQTPNFLWPEAIAHAAYLHDRTHTWALNTKTPLEAWCGRKPDISHLREFGSPVWILTEGQITKLQPQSIKHTFMGFMDGPEAIKYYDASTRQVRVSRNFQFPALSASQMNANTSVTLLHKNPAQSEGESTPNGTESNREKVTHPYESNNESSNRKRKRHADKLPNSKVRKSKRQKEMHDYRLLNNPWADDDKTGETTGTTSSKMARMTSTERVYATSSELNVMPDNPRSLHKARDSPDWPNWEKAMKAKLDQLHKMGTWELVDPPEGRTAIPNKWVLTKKYDKEANLLKYKARLVAKGYSQQPGMDYTDTFSLVVCLETIWTLLALAIAEDWEIQQMDVKRAYLNGTIKEKIYMRQPKGYDDHGTGCLCHLIKSLYGLKQAGREWNNELNKQLESLGWKPTMVDPCAYARRSTEGIEVVAMWVDDLLLFASNKSLMKKIKVKLESTFDITDLGEPAKIIGIEIDRDCAKRTIIISQKQYIESILQKEELTDAHPVAVPMDPNIQLQPSEGEAQDKSNSYASLIRSLMYLAIATRPDIAYAVFKLGSYMANPAMSHWVAAKRILQYLSGTQGYGITYQAEEVKQNQFFGYSDVSYANNDDATSISGYAFIMGGGAITWGSKKQTSVSVTISSFPYACGC